MEEDENPILHVCVVGFHHKKGCQLEYAYPPLIAGNAPDSCQLPEPWKHLPSMAIPDGAHNFDKDTIYFHLSALDGSRRTVFGISCYRQIAAQDLVRKSADVTRSTVQKSVCVLSKLPLYGLIQAKLELITHAYFDELDFSQVSLLEETYRNLSASIGLSAIKGSQVFLGMSACDVVRKYRHSILVLFKLLLLERRVLFYMSPVEALNNIMLGVVSLFPSMIEGGLLEAAGESTRLYADDLQVEQYGSEEYLELHYVQDAPDIIKSHVPMSSSIEITSPRSAPDTPINARPRATSVSSPRENTWSSVERQNGDDVVAWTSKTSGREGSAETALRPDALPGVVVGVSHDGRPSPVSSAATYVQPLAVVCEQPKPAPSSSTAAAGGASGSGGVYNGSLAAIDQLTSVELVQERELDDDQAPLDISYAKEQISFSNRSVVDLDSPESLHQIDQEDCFSWEEDRLLLEIEEELVHGRKETKAETKVEKSASSSLDHQVVIRSLQRADSDSGISSCSSKQTEMRNARSGNNVSIAHAQSMTSRTRLSEERTSPGRVREGVHRPTPVQRTTRGGDVTGAASRDTDECGFPLALFTKGSICHPYLSLQYFSVLDDVNVRSFTIGATNILFKQKKLLTDAVVGDDESLIEIRDSELKKQLSLTTADLRFADYIVKNVVQESQDVFLDGTGWEGGEEWIRVQFRMYLMALLITCKHGDDKLEEDFGSHFVNALKTTHHYKVWLDDPNVHLGQFEPGHPFQGQVSISDMRLKWITTMQNTGKGRKINAAVHHTGKAAMQAGKAVGGAFSTAKSAVSGWLSGWSKEK